MTNQFTHIADVKVGKVKGNSRMYPPLRLPSQYAELAGKKASINEIRGHVRILLSLLGLTTKTMERPIMGTHIPKGVWPTGAKCPLSPVETPPHNEKELVKKVVSNSSLASM